ncbi:SiaB family protein kinase [Tistrella bauzanensis]|uniref:SiaB family protein kinase n=1 Tax=Tistrella arctica TaxID=3133430 RepID=A0ABU9YR92_9PROT
MLARELFEFRSQIQAHKLMLVYSGIMSEGILFSLGEALRRKLEQDDTDRNLTRRVFSVFVEQVQNIIRYSGDAEGSAGTAAGDAGAGAGAGALRSGIVTVGKDGGRFFVICANMIDSAKAPRLRSRLEELAALSPEELKVLYRRKLKEEPEAESQGATLGLIEIARRASSPIEFDFFEVDAQTTFYCIRVFI